MEDCLHSGPSRGLRGLAATLLAAAVLVCGACNRAEPPLLIGYLGGLTGRAAGLGVAGRDGTILAIEEINRAGGIAGRPLELIIRDDRQNPEVAKQAFRELADAGVVAVIGPMTSAVALAIQPDADRLGVVLVSPTVTTTRLTDRQDSFFRVTVPLQVNAAKAAEFAFSRGQQRFAVVIDTGNAAYTEDWFENFRQALQAAGGEVIAVERFVSANDVLFLPIAQRMIKAAPDAVLLLSSAMDTAIFAQQLRKLGSDLPLYGSEWSFTSDVINFGGGATEGMKAFVTYDPAGQSPRHLAFRTDFERHFGYPPSFAGVLAYEATTLLAKGLERNPRRVGLSQALLEVGQFSGLQGEIRINRYGEPQRQTYLAVIQGGEFITSR